MALKLAEPFPLAALVVLLAVAIPLRLINLGAFPYRVDGDAAREARSALEFLGANPPPLFSTGWLGQTNVLFFAESLFLRPFGTTILATRVFAASGGIAGVAAIFLCGRMLLGNRAGFFAALAAAVMPFNLVFARIGVEDAQTTWFVPLLITLVWVGWRDSSRLALLAGGGMLALAQYFDHSSRLLLLLAPAMIGLLTIFPPDGARSWRRGCHALAWATVGFLICYGPMLAYYIRNPLAYTSRLDTVSIFTSGWLQEKLQVAPWWQVIGEQVLRTFAPFVYPVGGTAMWYLWPEYLGSADAALLILGLICLWVSRTLPPWLRWFIALYFVAGFFTAGTLTIDSPMPSRYVTFIIPVALCIGIGIEQIVRAVGEAMQPEERGALAWVLPGALVLYALLNINAYIRHDQDSVWRFSQSNQIASFAARYLEAMPPVAYNIAYLATPNDYFESNPALAFVSQRSGTNIPQGASCSEIASVLTPGEQVVIAPRDRVAELRNMQRLLPEATFELFRDPGNTEMAAIMRVNVPPEGAFNQLCAK